MRVTAPFPSLEYASQNHVIMLSVPPHTTHRLQPLDRTVYGPLSAYYEQAIDAFQKSHPSRRIQITDMAFLFGQAYQKACAIANATSGFAKCGISPYNSNIFNDDEFAPSAVTDMPIQQGAPEAQPDVEQQGAHEEQLDVERQRALEIQPDVKRQGVPEAQPDVEQQGVPKAQPDVEQQGAPEDQPDVDQQGAPEDQPDVEQQGAPEDQPDVEQQGAHEDQPDVEQQGAPEDQPDVEQQGAHEDQPDVEQQGAPEDQPDVEQQGAHEDQPGVEQQHAVEVQPDVEQQGAPEALNDPLPNESDGEAPIGVTPEDILPIPHVTRERVVSRKRKTLRAEILTSSPIKKVARERAAQAATRGRSRATRQAPAIHGRPAARGRQVSTAQRSQASADRQTEEYSCLVCGTEYTDPPTEDWIQCSTCDGWAHEDCTSYEGGFYRCDNCE